MSHYFVEDKSLKSEINRFSYTFQGREFHFISDNGLFSKEHIDYASNLLIQNIGSLSGSLLDMGCGYGTIGIMLAGIYKLKVTLADVNPKAIEFAKINCKNNQITAECIVSDRFDNITKNYDTIAINPPIHAGKQIIFEMYEESLRHLNNGGSLYIVIQKKHGAKSTKDKLIDIFGNCNELYKKKGFYIFQCIRSE